MCIEGRIDRLDRLPDDRLKIIDYKSGNLQLKQEEVRAGYRLQLMLYMRAAQGDSSQTEPAGDEVVQEEIRRLFPYTGSQSRREHYGSIGQRR